MFTQSARFYDALHRAAGKDYVAEAAEIVAIVDRYGRSGGNTLLDLGCGTGKHIEAFGERFVCEGLDADRTMLDIARDRNPSAHFQLGDLIGFNVGKRFDVVICLFGSIAYLPNAGRLDQALASIARHLRPGGVAIVEPWFEPQEWRSGDLHALYVDEPDLKIARMDVGRRDGNVSLLNFHYMAASRDGIRTFTEPHRLTLFTDKEYRAAFESAGLRVLLEEAPPFKRGLYVGTTP